MENMTQISVSVTDQVLKIMESPILASGGLNEIRVVFSFCEKWDSFVKTAIFYRDEENVYYAVLDENDTCVVPWEVCYEEGTFYFSVFGEKADSRRTASVVRYKVKKGAITTDMLPSDPTPEVYDQIMAMLAEAKEEQENFIAEAGEVIDNANTAAGNANAATVKANAAESNAEIATSNANTATANANQATQNANTAASNAVAEAEKAIQAAADANAATQNANNAASEARAATEETNTARETFLQDAGEILSSLSGAVYATPIECTATGDVIAVKDASNQQLAGLNLYGKTTQNGTPTPASPVPLESAGESGAISLTVAGKNLIDFSKITRGYELKNASGELMQNDDWYVTDFIPVAPLTTYVISGTSSQFRVELNADYYADPGYSVGGNVFTTKADTKFVRFNSKYDGYTTPQLELGDTATAYENGKPIQTLTASTPNGLHGIDSVKDEIDFARGVRVQRFREVDMGSLNWKYWVASDGILTFFYVDISDKTKGTGKVLCTAYTPVYTGDSFMADGKDKLVYSGAYLGYYKMQVRDSAYTDAIAFKAAVSGQTILYELETPIETPLTAEELASYAALHSNKPNTTVFNDGGAGLKLAYNADTKLYIDNKINELATAILNNA